MPHPPELRLLDVPVTPKRCGGMPRVWACLAAIGVAALVVGAVAGAAYLGQMLWETTDGSPFMG